MSNSSVSGSRSQQVVLHEPGHCSQTAAHASSLSAHNGPFSAHSIHLAASNSQLNTHSSQLEGNTNQASIPPACCIAATLGEAFTSYTPVTADLTALSCAIPPSKLQLEESDSSALLYATTSFTHLSSSASPLSPCHAGHLPSLECQSAESDKQPEERNCRIIKSPSHVSVCWEQRNSSISQEQKLATFGESPKVSEPYKQAPIFCQYPRPPVLGEEQQIVQVEEITVEQDLMMQAGDGWGECPAVVGSCEASSPVDCNMGCASGSLEYNSSGSSSHSGCSNPLEWGISLDRLLDDPAGVAIFNHYLVEETGSANNLTFYFACQGLGKQSEDDLKQLLPLIWKKFIRNYSVPVSREVHGELAAKILGKVLSPDMFRDAQKEVYERIKETTYPAFLQSQLYIDQVQQHSSAKLDHSSISISEAMYNSSAPVLSDDRLSSVHYSSSSSVHAVRGGAIGIEPLSTVYEHESPVSSSVAVSTSFTDTNPPRLRSRHSNAAPGQSKYSPNSRPPIVLRSTDTVESAMVTSLGAMGIGDRNRRRLHLTPGALAATVGQRAKLGSRTGCNPYHSQYAIGHHSSRHDSEGHSLSSGAHTDDTRSCTDSSLDGANVGRSALCVGKQQLRRQRAQMKQNLRLNEEMQQRHGSILSPKGLVESVIPRTQVGVSESSNLARDPARFASVLTQKLEALQKERDAHERMQHAFRKIQENEGSADVYRREHAVNSLPPTLLITKILQKIPVDDDDCGQAILDEHVSRVWQESSGESSVCSPSPPHHPFYPVTGQRVVPYSAAPPPVSSAVFAATAAAASERTILSKAHLKSYKQNGAAISIGRHAPSVTGSRVYQQQYQLDGYAVAAAAASTTPLLAPEISLSKIWQQTKHRDVKGPDVYSTFSSDSGKVSDYYDASQRGSGRRHQHSGSGMPKARSVPEHMMDNCTGSEGERYLLTSSESRSRRGAGAADLTDSGVSVISDSRQSLLTNPSCSKLRVETWLESTEGSHKLSSSCSSVRGASLEPQSFSTHIMHNKRGPSSVSGGNSQRWQQQITTGSQEAMRRRHRWDQLSSTRTGSCLPPPVTSCHGTETSPSAPVQGLSAVAPSSNTGDTGATSLSSSTATVAAVCATSTGTAAGSAVVVSSSSTIKKHRASGASSKHGPSKALSSEGSCYVRPSDVSSSVTESTTVVYSFCDDSVPFVIKIPARSITLHRFKHHLPKRGHYRFFFKKHCEEFNGVVLEEMTEDDEVLPLYEGRIFAQIRKAD